MRATTETDSNTSISYSIPVHADFLIAYSTIPGMLSSTLKNVSLPALVKLVNLKVGKELLIRFQSDAQRRRSHRFPLTELCYG